MSYLGSVINDTKRHVRCARLALLKGYDHFAWDENACFSSYALPANVYKLDDETGNKQESDNEHRENLRPYFIKGLSKFSLL